MSWMIEKARDWAVVWHEGQKYGTDRPYTVHLDHVVSIMKRFDIEDEDIICAGYLHDTIEDCEHVTLATLTNRFNFRVATLVDAVTDSKEGKNRKERHQRALDLIPTVPGAILVKLADQIGNIETCLQDEDKRINMYQKESQHFWECLYEHVPRSTQEKMWRYRDKILWCMEAGK